MKFFIYFVGFLICAAFFQNCGEIKVKNRPLSTADFSSISYNVGSFCAPDTVSVSLPQKILMVMDMSASNVGFEQLVSYDYASTPATMTTEYWIGEQAYTQCIADHAGDTSVCNKATDLGGNRFTALQSFLNLCPQNMGSDNKYGVIGFGSYPVSPKNFSRSCQDPLVDKATALAEINGLFALQTDDLSHPYEHNPVSYPYRLTDTSYSNALKCLDDRIRNDLNPRDFQKDYKVLFLTDGKPSDYDQSTYVNQITNIKSFLSGRGFNLVFQPIYYGLAPTTPQTQVEAAAAYARLDSMAKAVSSSASPIVLDPLNPDFRTSLSNSLCNTPIETLKVPFALDGSVSFYSLSSQQVGDQIFADSDMDGVDDDLELANASNGLQDRSQILLDSLCLKYKKECTSFELSRPVCDKTKKVGFGFSECDKKFIDENILKIPQNYGKKAFTGVDYDNDGVIDFIELTKGTQMFTADASGDLDGDGLTQSQEMELGLDPNSFTTASLQQKFGSHFEVSESQGCTTSGFDVNSSQVTLVDVKALSEVSITPHAAGENVFLAIYKSRMTGYQTKTLKYFGQLVKISKGKTPVILPPFEIGLEETP